MAKYYDEHVCVSVCVSICLSVREHISGTKTTRAIFSLLISLCMLPVVVARSSSGRVTKSQGEGAVLGDFSSPLTMHCNAFAAKGIIQSTITSCIRRNHSVAAAFAANGIGREGDDDHDGSSQRGRSVVCDCLVKAAVNRSAYYV